MNDLTLTDMTPFLKGHDNKSRRVFVAIVSVSLAVSAVIFAYGLGATGAPGAVIADLWMPIFFYPLFLITFWIANVVWARTRLQPPGGRFLMNPDDARNIARVANAGFTFVAGFGAVMIASQAGIALAHFETLQSLGMGGDWTGRAILLALGALSIYFGNAWARMPTPRTPEQKPATQMKYQRLAAWLTVITGLLLGMAALLPIRLMIPVIGVVSVSVVLAWVMYFVSLRNAMRSPNAS